MFREKTGRNAATLSPQDNRTRKQRLIKTEMSGKRTSEKSCTLSSQDKATGESCLIKPKSSTEQT